MARISKEAVQSRPQVIENWVLTVPRVTMVLWSAEDEAGQGMGSAPVVGTVTGPVVEEAEEVAVVVSLRVTVEVR